MCYGVQMMRYQPHGTVRYYFTEQTRFTYSFLDPTVTPEMSFKIKQGIVPKCECHGINMRWYTDRSQKYGGSFRCPIKRRESQRAYNKRRYRGNQIYRTNDVIRLRRERREAAIVLGEEQLRKIYERMKFETTY